MNPDRYAKIKQLFLGAAELGAVERDKFLTEQCGSDLALRKEIESLLDHHSPQTIFPGDRTDRRSLIATKANNDQTTRLPPKRSPARAPRLPRLGPKGQLAAGAAIAAVLLVLFGWWQRNEVHQLLNQTLHDRLTALIEGHVEAFEHWAKFEHKIVKTWVRNPEFRSQVRRLVELDDGSSDAYADKLRRAPEQAAIRRELRLAGGENIQYVIFNLKQIVIAEQPEKGLGLGTIASKSAASNLAHVFRGETILFVDNIKNLVHEKYPPTQVVTDVFVAAPIRNANEQIVAVIAVFNVDTALMQNTI